MNSTDVEHDEPTFWDVFGDAVQYNWTQGGLSGKLLVTTLFVALVVSVAVVVWSVWEVLL